MGGFWGVSEVWACVGSVLGMSLRVLGVFWECSGVCWERFGSVWRRLGSGSVLERLEVFWKPLNTFCVLWERMGAFGRLGRLVSIISYGMYDMLLYGK